MIYGNVVRQYENNINPSINSIDESSYILESLYKEQSNYSNLLEDAFLTEEEREILEAKYEVINEAVGAAIIAAIIAAIGALIALIIALTKILRSGVSNVTQKVKEKVKEQITNDTNKPKDESSKSGNKETQLNTNYSPNPKIIKSNDKSDEKKKVEQDEEKERRRELEKELERNRKINELEKELERNRKINKAAREMMEKVDRILANEKGLYDFNYSSESTKWIVNKVKGEDKEELEHGISNINYADYINQNCVQELITHAEKIIELNQQHEYLSPELEKDIVIFADKMECDRFLNKTIFSNVPSDKLKLDTKDIMVFLYKNVEPLNDEDTIFSGNEVCSMIQRRYDKAIPSIRKIEKDLEILKKDIVKIKKIYFNGEYMKPGWTDNDLVNNDREFMKKYDDYEYDYSDEIKDKREIIDNMDDDSNVFGVDSDSHVEGKNRKEKFINTMLKVNGIGVKKITQFIKFWEQIETKRINFVNHRLLNSVTYLRKAMIYDIYQEYIKKYGDGIKRYLLSDYEIEKLES